MTRHNMILWLWGVGALCATGSAACNGEQPTDDEASCVTSAPDPERIAAVAPGTAGQCVPTRVGADKTVCLMSQPQDALAVPGQDIPFDAEPGCAPVARTQTLEPELLTPIEIGGEQVSAASVFGANGDDRDVTDCVGAPTDQSGLPWCIPFQVATAVRIAACSQRDETDVEPISKPHIWDNGRIGGGDQGSQCTGWVLSSAVNAATHPLAPSSVWPHREVDDDDPDKQCTDVIRRIDEARPDDSTLEDAASFQITETEPIRIQVVDDIRLVIAEGKPVIISLPLFRCANWFAAPDDSCGGEPDTPDTIGLYADDDEPVRQDGKLCRCSDCSDGACLAGYHALTLVAFDDGEQRFRLINTWGDAWKDGGLAWIDYDYVKEHSRGGVAISGVAVESGGSIDRDIYCRPSLECRGCCSVADYEECTRNDAPADCSGSGVDTCECLGSGDCENACQ